MTAKEAKEKTDRNRHGIYAEIFQHIDVEIEESISCGEYSIDITKSLICHELSSEVRKTISDHYTDLGYKFKDNVASELDPVVISRISWDEPKYEGMPVDKINKLTVKLLEETSDIFGNRSCNDIPDEFMDGWTVEEKNQLAMDYHEMNGDPEEYIEGVFDLSDFMLVDIMIHKLKNSQI